MIRYIDHKDIDKIKWDNCIDHSINGIIYAYSWYLDAVCKEWGALVEDNYVGVMPLPINRKYGVNYIYHPFFAQQLGVFSIHPLTQENIQNFLSTIPPKFKFIEQNLNTSNLFSISGVEVKNNLTHELGLNPPYEKLYKSFSDNIKRNIKKAEKEGVQVSLNISEKEVINLFRKNKGKEVSNLSGKDYIRLEHLINTCLKKGKAQVWGVKTTKNELCAGVIFIQSHGKVIYFVSASNDKGKSSGAMAFLVNSFIKENATKDLVLDFEGSNDLNLARFYKSFGSKERVYLFIKRNNLPKIIRFIKK